MKKTLYYDRDLYSIKYPCGTLSIVQYIQQSVQFEHLARFLSLFFRSAIDKRKK